MPRTFYAHAAPDCISNRKSGVLVDRIVIHACDGTFNGTLAWFAKAGRSPPTSAHYVVSRAGDVAQCVADDKRALHAGGYNSRSIGIELEARLNPWPARTLADGSTKPPPFSVNEFPDAMLISAARVTRVLCAKYGIPVDRSHIIGHVEVPGATHTDPGPFWDWPAFMERVSS